MRPSPHRQRFCRVERCSVPQRRCASPSNRPLLWRVPSAAQSDACWKRSLSCLESTGFGSFGWRLRTLVWSGADSACDPEDRLCHRIATALGQRGTSTRGAACGNVRGSMCWAAGDGGPRGRRMGDTARAEHSRPRLDPGHAWRHRAAARRRSAAAPARRFTDPPRHGRAGGSGRGCRVRGRTDRGCGYHCAQLCGAVAPGARGHRGHQGTWLPALSGRLAFDVAEFEADVAAGRAALHRQEPVAAIERLRSALALWQGEAYAEFADEPWAYPESQHLAELRSLPRSSSSRPSLRAATSPRSCRRSRHSAGGTRSGSRSGSS